jgi:hypothetical protein
MEETMNFLEKYKEFDKKMDKEARMGISKMWLYALRWIAAIVAGFVCWFLASDFITGGHIATFGNGHNLLTSVFVYGALVGAMGIVSVWCLIDAIVPVIQWAWNRRVHTEAFLEFI